MLSGLRRSLRCTTGLAAVTMLLLAAVGTAPVAVASDTAPPPRTGQAAGGSAITDRPVAEETAADRAATEKAVTDKAGGEKSRPRAPIASVVGLDGAPVPHQIAVNPSTGDMYFAAANLGALGHVKSGQRAVDFIALGTGVKPRGIAIGRDGRVFVLDHSQDAIIVYDPRTGDIRRIMMPSAAVHLELQMSAFDSAGRLWFTGYSGWYGRLDPDSGKIKLYRATGGRGPFAIVRGGEGEMWFASYAGNYIGRIDTRTGKAETFRLPAEAEGPKGIAIDRAGKVWCASMKDGTLVRFDPATKGFDVHRAPAGGSRLYALVSDANGMLWTSDVGENRIWRFDPSNGVFAAAYTNLPRAMVRHLAVGIDVVWAAESATDRLIAISNPSRGQPLTQ
jgi:virginiamycin B lyase